MKKNLLVPLLLMAWTAFTVSPCLCEDQSESTVLELAHTANEKFWKREFPCARKACQELSKCCTNKVSKARLLVNMAICDAQMENWSLAEKEAKDAIAIACPDAEPLTRADGLSVLGRCLVMDKKISAAKDSYMQALDSSSKLLGPWNCDLAPIYEGLGACCFDENQMQMAREFYKKVAQLDYLKYGGDSVQFAWSLLSLINVLEDLHENDIAHGFYTKVFWNFRHQNEERILSENHITAPNDPMVAKLRKQMYGCNNGYENRKQGLDFVEDDVPQEVVASPCSRPHDFDNWFIDRIGRETAPGLAFFDPKTKLKALIVTIHGLGLHHGAYTPFAEYVQHKGFGVISFDVRGFGSYRNDQVSQQVDFKAILNDMHRILSELRRDYKEMPIFVLGESMGGAIALRIAALDPDLINGVVSSVPSGSRFHAKSTAIEVAVKFLTNSHKQFNIGQQVVDQATSNEDLRSAWADDPNARMNFSASELVKFQKFMNENMSYAEKITNTPVIIFQGYSDELVKPLGTLALYQAIKSRDKDLVFVGHSEHLIFEEGQFDQDVVDGTLSWLDRHIAKPQDQNVAVQPNN